jgi:1,4-alpha-glucan branching enzyme
VPHTAFQLPLPFVGTWKEIFNTDAEDFGGTDQGNLGEVHAVAKPHYGRPASAEMMVPPFGTVWLEFQAGN